MSKLTFSEIYELKIIAEAVLDIMEPDEILSTDDEIVYSDGGRFLHNMTEKERNNLKKIVKK